MIETGLIDRKGQHLCEFMTENSRSKKSRRRHKKPMQTLVQKLYETCKEVFSGCGPGIIPSPENIELLRSVLDSMDAVDVGLNPDMPYFQRIDIEGAPPVTYLRIYECSKFSIGIFCLPPTAVIPLHNHPGMTVFSKILFGSMHIKSYDWADRPHNPNGNLDPSQSQLSGLRLAKVKTDATFTAPCNTTILYPASGGNMHRFTAVTACAVLDVLGPPYSDPEGRHCTYYRDFPYSSFKDVIGDLGNVGGEINEMGYAGLQEKDETDDFFVIGAKYGGPKIVES